MQKIIEAVTSPRGLLLKARMSLFAGVLALALTAHATDQVPLKGAFETIHQDTFGFDPQLGPIISVVVRGEGNLAHLGATTCFTDNQIAVLGTGSVVAT